MPRRGRPKKHKVREASGRGSRAEEKRTNEAFARWQRRHLLGIVPLELLLDPKVSTPLGALYVGQKITKSEFDAGEDYEKVVRHYRVVSGMPLELPSRLGVRGADNREFPPSVVAAAKRKYAILRRKLVKAGKGVLSAVTSLVIDQRLTRRLPLVRKGLSALAGDDKEVSRSVEVV